jgi:DNA primase
MDSAVEEIKSRINIVDFVGGYVQLQKAGANWKACCPFHNEKSPSFMVNEEKQIFHCFGCGKGGDVFRFIMEMDGLEFKEALKILAERTGVKLETRGRDNSFDKKKLFDILELSVKFYEKQLWDGSGKNKILSYLRDRGLTDETIKSFRIGYVPAGWRNLLAFLTGRGYKPEDIIKTGLLVNKNASETPTTNYRLPASPASRQTTNYYDRFRDRITFPIFDVMGKTVGFSARVAPDGDESQAKYVNTPETAVYSKSFILYGIDKAKREMKEKDFALLVEGNLDVIAAHQAGFTNTVAVSGTALTVQQLDIIKRYTPNIKMFFDMDAAGKAALRRSAELCFSRDINVYVVTTDAGKDAAEIVKKNPAILQEAVDKSIPAMEYFIAEIKNEINISEPTGKKEAVKKILEIISYFSSPVEKDSWIKKIASDMDVEEKIIRDLSSKKQPGYQALDRKEAEQKSDDIVEKNRFDRIIEKVVSYMIAYPAIWQKLAETSNDRAVEYMKKNSLFQKLIEKGSKINFNQKGLSGDQDPDLEKAMARLIFRQEEASDSETTQTSAEAQVEKYIDDIRREIAKQQLTEIATDLKKAEKSGDKEAVKVLISEFNRICAELK